MERNVAIYKLCELIASANDGSSEEDKAITHYLRQCEMQKAINEAKDKAEAEVRKEYAAKYPLDLDPDHKDGDGSNAEIFFDFLNEKLLFKPTRVDFDD